MLEKALNDDWFGPETIFAETPTKFIWHGVDCEVPYCVRPYYIGGCY